LVKPNEFKIIEKMQTNTFPLQNIILEQAKGDLNLGTDKDKFSQNKTTVKLLRGKNLCRFHIDYNTNEFIQNGFKQNIVIKNTQNHYLIHQQITGTTDKYRLHFALTNTNEKFLCGDSIGKILVENKYQLHILGILNSNLLDWYFRKTSTNNNVNGYEIEQLPIPKITPRKQQPIIDLVNKILSSKTKNPIADTTKLESKIDRLVYELYDLTEDEIKIIEG
jgi:hypothetical protein